MKKSKTRSKVRPAKRPVAAKKLSTTAFVRFAAKTLGMGGHSGCA